MKQLVAVLKRKFVLPMLLLSMCQIVGASAKEQDYAASKQAVFNAAVKVIQKDWNINFLDRETGIISFKTGTSFRSNGMECQVSVIEVSASQTELRVGAQKTGGQVVAWGAGGSIASKIFKGVEDELNSSARVAVTPAVAPTQAAAVAPVAPPASVVKQSALAAMPQPASVSLKQAVSDPPVQAASAVPIPVPSNPPQANVEFWSDPAGADVEMDGKHIGTTPSTMAVGAGEHTFTMRKQNCRTWSKTINVASGTLRVGAHMQQVAITLP